MSNLESVQTTYYNLLAVLRKHEYSKDVLKEINKSKSTLNRELSPTDKKAKLGLETFLYILPYLTTDKQIEIRKLLDEILPNHEPIKEVKVRKKEPILEDDQLKTKNIEEFVDSIKEYADPYEEPIGKMYMKNTTATEETIESTLPIHYQKRTRKDYTVPSYVSK